MAKRAFGREAQKKIKKQKAAFYSGKKAVFPIMRE